MDGGGRQWTAMDNNGRGLMAMDGLRQDGDAWLATAMALLAGYVGNMLATCWQLVKMSLIFDQHACRHQHKNDPVTRFLCQGLPTQPYTTHNHNPAAPLLRHPHPSLPLLLQTHSSSTGRMGERQGSSRAAAAE